jgi:CubicO group peptidase (beta-lactamase class C family)
MIAAVVLLPLVQPDAAAQTGAGARAGQAVDELFRQWHTPETPGAAVLVIAGGRVVHAKGYGMANLEHGVPIRPHSVFDIASVSKQFGAMAIALLEADGLLSLDDDVRRYLPELHDFGGTITLRHLIHHTSGIRDWPGTMRIAGWDYQDIISFDQILRLAFHQRELNFAPGSQYAYSNTGYNLLAEIVQRVSGQSFSDFTEQRIFGPLGMKHTRFHDDHTRVVPNRAESYRRTQDGSYRHVGNSLTALASSSLFTTIEDLALWIGNFTSGAVGGPALVARLHERGVLSGGDTIAYAFGQTIDAHRGVPTVTHTGSWAGYRTILQRFPDHDFAVVILANTPDINPSQLAARIAEIYLGSALAPAPVVATGTTGPAGGGGAAARWAPAAAELRAYEGRYTSQELLTGWLLHVRDGRLVATHLRSGDVALQPVERDRFQSGIFGEVRFLRDAQGAVTGFTANSDRVRALRFDRER